MSPSETNGQPPAAGFQYSAQTSYDTATDSHWSAGTIPHPYMRDGRYTMTADTQQPAPSMQSPHAKKKKAGRVTHQTDGPTQDFGQPAMQPEYVVSTSQWGAPPKPLYNYYGANQPAGMPHSQMAQQDYGYPEQYGVDEESTDGTTGNPYQGSGY